MTDHLRNQITSFRQEEDEAMHKAWERYRDLFRRCPCMVCQSGPKYQSSTILSTTPTRMMHDASANGTLLNKPPRESLEIWTSLHRMTTSIPLSKGSTRRGLVQLDSSDTILARLPA
ncbi:hypothetical protein GQ457_05G022310 [Hibiscus cannabinus]